MAREYLKDPGYLRDMRDASVRAVNRTADEQPADRRKAIEEERKKVFEKWDAKQADAKAKAEAKPDTKAKADKPPTDAQRARAGNAVLQTDTRHTNPNIESPAPLAGETIREIANP